MQTQEIDCGLNRVIASVDEEHRHRNGVDVLDGRDAIEAWIIRTADAEMSSS